MLEDCRYIFSLKPVLHCSFPNWANAKLLRFCRTPCDPIAKGTRKRKAGEQNRFDHYTYSKLNSWYLPLESKYSKCRRVS